MTTVLHRPHKSFCKVVPQAHEITKNVEFSFLIWRYEKKTVILRLE